MSTGPNGEVGSVECRWDCQVLVMKLVGFSGGVREKNALEDRILF